MIRVCNLKYHVFLIVVILFVATSTCFSMTGTDPNEVLYKCLAEIAAKTSVADANSMRIEMDYMALLEKHNSPAQKGKIYAAMAEAYSSKGFTSRDDGNIDKTVEYCLKALDCPLDAMTSCEMYSRLANSIVVEFWELPQDQFVKLRREAIVVCLEGLRIALDNNAPGAIPDPPTTDLFKYDSNRSDRSKIMKSYQARRVELRKKWENDYEFFLLRDGLTGLCVSLYSHEPYNIDELKEISQTALVNKTEVVDELVLKIQAKIREMQQ